MKRYILLGLIGVIVGLVAFAVAHAAGFDAFLKYKAYSVNNQTILKFVDPDNGATCYVEEGVMGDNDVTHSQYISCVGK